MTGRETVVHIARAKPRKADRGTDRRGRLVWSGYNGTGDAQQHPKMVARVDVGTSDFRIGHDGVLIVTPVDKLSGFSPAALMIAARSGLFGFGLIT